MSEFQPSFSTGDRRDLLAHIEAQRLQIEKLEKDLAVSHAFETAFLVERDSARREVKRLEQRIAALRELAIDLSQKHAQCEYGCNAVAAGKIMDLIIPERAILSEPPAQADRGAVAAQGDGE